MKNIRFYFGLLLITSIAFSSCKDNNPEPPKDKGMADLVIDNNFDWSTTKDWTFKVKALDNTNQPIKGAKILIYTNNPKDKLLYKQNAELIGFIYPKTFLGICFSKKDTLLYGGAIFGYNNFYLKMIGRKSYYEAEFGYTIKKWF